MDELEQQGSELEIDAYKKDINKMAAVLLWSHLISTVVSIVGGVAIGIYVVANVVKDTLSLEAYIEAILGYVFIILAISGIAETIFTMIYGKKCLGISRIFTPSKKMGLKSFGKIFSCALGCGFLWVIIIAVVSSILSHFNISITETRDSATIFGSTIIGFIWVGFGAPISEEIIFRGVLLKAFKKYGKVFAIVLSAVLFGCVHMNFQQGIFATCIGLLYGYVACEYSVKWTIFLHIFHNAVLAVGLGRISEFIPAEVFNILYYGLAVAAMAAAAIVLIKSRKNIKNYISKNNSQKGCYKYAFRSGCMIAICTCCLLAAVLILALSINVLGKTETLQSFSAQEAERELYDQADTHLQENENEEALLIYDQLLDQSQGNSRIYSNMSRAYNQLYDYELGLYYADKAIETAEEGPDYYMFKYKADALNGQYQTEEAIEYYRKAVYDVPLDDSAKMIDGYGALAEAYMDTKRTDEAIAVYERMLSIDRSNTQAFYGIEEQYVEQKEEGKLLFFGKCFFESATDVEPLYYYFASDLYSLGLYQEAAEYYIQHAEQSEENADSYYRAVKCFLELDDYESAKKWYQKCLEIDNIYEQMASEEGVLEKLQ